LSERFVLDTGPLSAFARVGRLDLLERRYAGRALWALEVRDEIARGVTRYPSLGQILDASWLGPPIRMTDPQVLAEIERLRWALGGPENKPDRHRGEAATIVLARRELAIAVLDDRDARSVAHALGVKFTGTIGILKASVGDRLIGLAEAWDLVQDMGRLGIRLPPGLRPESLDPDARA
jgi:predicted nucleic acid-binding protein